MDKFFLDSDVKTTGVYCAYTAIALSTANFIYQAYSIVEYISASNDAGDDDIGGSKNQELLTQKVLLVVSLASVVLSILCIIVGIKMYRSITKDSATNLPLLLKSLKVFVYFILFSIVGRIYATPTHKTDGEGHFGLTDVFVFGFVASIAGFIFVLHKLQRKHEAMNIAGLQQVKLDNDDV